VKREKEKKEKERLQNGARRVVEMKPVTQGQSLRKLFGRLYLLGLTSRKPLAPILGQSKFTAAPAKWIATISCALCISGGLFAILTINASLAAEQLPSASSQLPADSQELSLNGDSAIGQEIFEECRDCHSVQAGKYKTFGPNLYQIVGRKAGTAAQHIYSPALANAGFVWSAERLDSWLRDPQGFLPGSKMDSIMESEQARADVIAYLIAAGKR